MTSQVPASGDLIRTGRDLGGQPVALVDVLDRLLAGGVVLTGEVIISLSGVDLVHVSLRALISSAATLLEPRQGVPE